MLGYPTKETILELKQEVTVLTLIVLLSNIVLTKGAPKQIYCKN